MLRIEARIQQHLPHLFSATGARLGRPLLRHFSRFNRFEKLEQLEARHAHLDGLAFVESILREVDCRYLVDDVERECIPEQGRCLIVANHPLGGWDALTLLKFVGDIRRDVMIVANDWLLQVAPIQSLLLPLRILGGRPSAEHLAAIGAALDAEKAVIVFPSGEVSRLGWRGIRDRRWQRGFVTWAQRHAAPLVAVHLQARNSAAFYGLSAIYRPLGLAMLARELSHDQPRRIALRLRQVRTPGAVDPQSRSRFAEHVRSIVYTLPRSGKPGNSSTLPLAHRRPLRSLLQDIRALEWIGDTADGKQILCGCVASDSTLMHEIARLRELTFRRVGEGSGRHIDRDRFDTHYQQLVVWDGARMEIAGAYRIADCRSILARHGISGLYTSTLFEFSEAHRKDLDAAMELGRSFVQPRYWGSRSLDYLWMGIGAWLRRHPHVRILFGSVSISAALPLHAREWLVAYYSRFYGDPHASARARSPFSFTGMPPSFGDLDATSSFELLRANLHALGARVPTLYKQYTELCEPGGARFIGFGVDADFSNAIDGLIWVDLNRVTPRKRERYLSPAPSTPKCIAAAATLA